MQVQYPDEIGLSFSDDIVLFGLVFSNLVMLTFVPATLSPLLRFVRRVEPEPVAEPAAS
jgi:hypothetical protein